MTILCTERPVHPNDREALWVSMKAAYLNNEKAVNPFAVRPKYKINLATTRNESRQQPFSLTQFLAETLGWMLLLALAFGFVALLNVVMNP